MDSVGSMAGAAAAAPSAADARRAARRERERLRLREVEMRRKAWRQQHPASSWSSALYRKREYDKWIKEQGADECYSHDHSMAAFLKKKRKTRREEQKARDAEARFYNPSPEVRQFQQEYVRWLLERPDPCRDDEERDDSEYAFRQERALIRRQARREERKARDAEARFYNPSPEVRQLQQE